MLIDGKDHVVDATKHRSAYTIDGQVTKKSFDHIQPRCTGWSKVNVESGIPCEPCFHFLMFVCGVIIADNMDFFIGRNILADQI